MKNSHVFVLLAVMLASVSYYSCTSDSEALQASDIYGKWVVKEAFRGGKSTDLPVGMYFDFAENGKAKTNFNIESVDQELTYEMKEGAISMKGDSKLDIKVAKDLDGNLTFNTGLQGIKFKLLLEPASEEEK